MRIINASGELSPKETYLLCKAQNVQKMSDNIGVQFNVKAWAIYEEEDKKEEGKVNTILSLTDGECSMATNSPTFIESFMDIVDIFGNSNYHITVHEGISKNGRKFIQCIYVD